MRTVKARMQMQHVSEMKESSEPFGAASAALRADWIVLMIFKCMCAKYENVSLDCGIGLVV